ncbi:hypothetical protein ACR820_09345 [Streptomyces netropsis]
MRWRARLMRDARPIRPLLTATAAVLGVLAFRLVRASDRLLAAARRSDDRRRHTPQDHAPSPPRPHRRPDLVLLPHCSPRDGSSPG